jgi:hypothetical protein
MNKSHAGAVILVAALWGTFALFTYYWLVPIQQRSDFAPYWYGSRLMLGGTTPYQVATTPPDELRAEGLPYRGQPLLYLYPATTTYLLLPLWAFPFKVASSVWSALQLVFFCLLPLLLYSYLEWKPAPLFFGLIVFLSCVGLQNSLTVYTIGQFTGLALACVILAWWSICARAPAITVLSLAGLTLRPESVILAAVVVAFLLLGGRYRVVVAWGAVMTGLFALSLAQVGWWVPEFLDQALDYNDMGNNVWLPGLLSLPVLELAFTAGLLLWGVWFFCEVRTLPEDWRLLWALAVAIVVMLLVVPQSNDYTLVYALLPVWVLIALGDTGTRLALFLWLPLASYAAKFGFDRSGRTEYLYLWLHELFTPLVIGGLLTYTWWRGARFPSENSQKDFSQWQNGRR